MTRVRSTEEPCAAKVARTVLETSGGSDPLAEFTRAPRFAVLWRKLMPGTYNTKGDRWVERILSYRSTSLAVPSSKRRRMRPLGARYVATTRGLSPRNAWQMWVYRASNVMWA